MSTKRIKRNIVDVSLANTCKKSKNTISVKYNDDVYNGKSKKKENTNASLVVKKRTAEKKRKLSDADPLTSSSKKRGKLCSNLNNTEDMKCLSSDPSSNFNIKKELKKSKKKNMIPVNNDYYCVNNTTCNTVELIEPFIKTGKKKNKSDKEVISDNELNCLLKGDCSPSKDEVGTSCNKINDDYLNDVKIMKNDIPLEIGAAHISVKDLEEDHSNGNEIELCPVLTGQAEINGRVSKNKKVINWPEEDLKELVNRMEACIPEYDTLAFGTRAEKLEWESIAFKEYSVEDCKKTWVLLQKQIRKFRLLKEVLADARQWISAPKCKKGTKGMKQLRHPDMPRRPLTAFFIYYLQKKDELSKTHPGLDAPEISKLLGQEYKNLSPDIKLKYEYLAAKKKKEYEKKLEEFYQSHPDIPRAAKGQRVKPEKKRKPPRLPKPVKEKPPKPLKERIPKRPPPPFHYYYLSELDKEKQTDDRLAFKELCKDRWKQLPDQKKMVWINNAEMEYAKYEETLTQYLKTHPECVRNSHKPLLTKEEIEIKDRIAGKPSKPPCSAYNLFARVMLQSEEIKSVTVKDRLNFVSNQWKNCPDEEKKQYRDLSLKLNEKYKLDYASYLQSLPEEERRLELEKKISKRRKSESAEREKKEKPVKKKLDRKSASGKKVVEPEQPPISAFKYFATLYDGNESVLLAWKALSPEQKKIYEDELVKKKQAYIMDFEKFLKSLTKEELEAFSNSRRRIKKDTEDDEEEEEEETQTSDESGTEDSGAESNVEEDTVN